MVKTKGLKNFQLCLVDKVTGDTKEFFLVQTFNNKFSYSKMPIFAFSKREFQQIADGKKLVEGVMAFKMTNFNLLTNVIKDLEIRDVLPTTKEEAEKLIAMYKDTDWAFDLETYEKARKDLIEAYSTTSYEEVQKLTIEEMLFGKTSKLSEEKKKYIRDSFIEALFTFYKTTQEANERVQKFAKLISMYEKTVTDAQVDAGSFSIKPSILDNKLYSIVLKEVGEDRMYVRKTKRTITNVTFTELSENLDISETSGVITLQYFGNWIEEEDNSKEVKEQQEKLVALNNFYELIGDGYIEYLIKDGDTISEIIKALGLEDDTKFYEKTPEGTYVGLADINDIIAGKYIYYKDPNYVEQKATANTKKTDTTTGATTTDTKGVTGVVAGNTKKVYIPYKVVAGDEIHEIKTKKGLPADEPFYRKEGKKYVKISNIDLIYAKETIYYVTLIPDVAKELTTYTKVIITAETTAGAYAKEQNGTVYTLQTQANKKKKYAKLPLETILAKNDVIYFLPGNIEPNTSIEAPYIAGVKDVNIKSGQRVYLFESYTAQQGDNIWDLEHDLGVTVYSPKQVNGKWVKHPSVWLKLKETVVLTTKGYETSSAAEIVPATVKDVTTTVAKPLSDALLLESDGSKLKITNDITIFEGPFHIFIHSSGKSNEILTETITSEPGKNYSELVYSAHPLIFTGEVTIQVVLVKTKLNLLGLTKDLYIKDYFGLDTLLLKKQLQESTPNSYVSKEKTITVLL